jgi:hypothetical protein
MFAGLHRHIASALALLISAAGFVVLLAAAPERGMFSAARSVETVSQHRDFAPQPPHEPSRNAPSLNGAASCLAHGSCIPMLPESSFGWTAATSVAAAQAPQSDRSLAEWRSQPPDRPPRRAG